MKTNHVISSVTIHHRSTGEYVDQFMDRCPPSKCSQWGKLYAVEMDAELLRGLTTDAVRLLRDHATKDVPDEAPSHADFCECEKCYPRKGVVAPCTRLSFQRAGASCTVDTPCPGHF